MHGTPQDTSETEWLGGWWGPRIGGTSRSMTVGWGASPPLSQRARRDVGQSGWRPLFHVPGSACCRRHHVAARLRVSPGGLLLGMPRLGHVAGASSRARDPPTVQWRLADLLLLLDVLAAGRVDR